MAIANGLLVSHVAHARLRPKKNAFHYGVYYLCFPLSQTAHLKNALLSLNRWNLFSFRPKDYGTKESASPEAWIRGVLAEWNITEADGDVVLLTLPRVLGYAFNPVSFWFCLDKAGNLRAVLSEVSNTFGQRHSYLSFHDDKHPITADDWLRADKVFHVSPYIEVTGHYEFRFAYGEHKIGVWIYHHDAEGLLLTTSVTGKRIALTARNLLSCFFRYPLVTFKVISLIHYQALKLWLKGVQYRRCPAPPNTEVS